MTVFAPEARAIFAASYPEIPHILAHRVGQHPLLELDALAALAEALPAASIEYNKADLPIGVDGKPDPTGIPIGETIRRIARSGSWAVLKNVEQAPAYAALLADLLSELRPAIEATTGPMLKTQAYVFISSPGAVTPYHFDPEHNILLQIRGTKVLTQFATGDAAFAPDRVHETYHTGGGRELTWNEALAEGGSEFALGPGEAVYVPVMAPHFVRNGPAPSVSLSITCVPNGALLKPTRAPSTACCGAPGCDLLRPAAGPRATAPRRWAGGCCASSERVDARRTHPQWQRDGRPIPH